VEERRSLRQDVRFTASQFPRGSAFFVSQRQNMKNRARIFTRLVVGLLGILVLYSFSFFYFIRAHESTSLQNYNGYAVTNSVVAIPDTKMNRLKVLFYGPMIKCFVRAGTIEWRAP
jgi:hypothetical protein